MEFYGIKIGVKQEWYKNKQNCNTIFKKYSDMWFRSFAQVKKSNMSKLFVAEMELITDDIKKKQHNLSVFRGWLTIDLQKI